MNLQQVYTTFNSTTTRLLRVAQPIEPSLNLRPTEWVNTLPLLPL